MKIQIASYKDYHLLDRSLQNPEAVAYIKAHGKEDAKRWEEYLKPCLEPLTKIRSLVAKGQVLGFKNYGECQKACKMLAWQYDRIQALRVMIQDPALNWEHEKVQKLLTQVVTLDADEIQQEVTEQNVKFLAGC